jgi:hypothetical protein
MRMRVHEHGNEVHVELNGVAGRQQRVLQAINACQRDAWGCDASDEAVARAAVSVRAGSKDMWIRLRGRDGLRYDAAMVYRCLRQALIERTGGVAAAEQAVA